MDSPQQLHGDVEMNVNIFQAHPKDLLSTTLSEAAMTRAFVNFHRFNPGSYVQTMSEVKVWREIQQIDRMTYRVTAAATYENSGQSSIVIYNLGSLAAGRYHQTMRTRGG